jgi:pilus assembly protein CpaF
MIPDDERIIIVENTAEMQVDKKRLIRLESRPPNREGKDEVTVRDLLVNALRMRPDRIILSEARSAEVLDLLQAMDTGHDGSLTNVHANSVRDTVARLEMMVTHAEFSLPLLTVRKMIASAIDIIVHQARLKDGSRKVLNITEVVGMKGDVIELADIFIFRQTGMKEGRVTGHFTATGIIPKSLERIRDAGIELPLSMFTPS